MVCIGGDCTAVSVLLIHPLSYRQLQLMLFMLQATEGRSRIIVSIAATREFREISTPTIGSGSGYTGKLFIHTKEWWRVCR